MNTKKMLTGKKIFDIPSQINDNDKTIEIHNILNSIRLQGVDSKGNFWFNTGGRELVKYTPETNSVKKEINVKIYPNPSQNTIIINAEEPITKLALYSLNLSKINEYPANYTTTQEVDISIIPSGIYFIKVNDDLIKFVRE